VRNDLFDNAGPEPHLAIAAISRQLVGEEASSAGFVYHHDASKDVLYLGLPLKASTVLLTETSARSLLHTGCSVTSLYFLFNVSLPCGVQAQDASGLRAALLLFLSCHAIVWVQAPGAAPDARTLGTLRLLQQAKQLLVPSLPELLADALDTPSASSGPKNACPPWGQPPLLLFLCQVGGPNLSCACGRRRQ
jgi:hypothetical protein